MQICQVILVQVERGLQQTYIIHVGESKEHHCYAIGPLFSLCLLMGPFTEKRFCSICQYTIYPSFWVSGPAFFGSTYYTGFSLMSNTIRVWTKTRTECVGVRQYIEQNEICWKSSGANEFCSVIYSSTSLNSRQLSCQTKVPRTKPVPLLFHLCYKKQRTCFSHV